MGDHTDPVYIGPGTWNVMHRLAIKATTKEKQLAFMEVVKEICYGFPCRNCSDHVHVHCFEYKRNFYFYLF